MSVCIGKDITRCKCGMRIGLPPTAQTNVGQLVPQSRRSRFRMCGVVENARSGQDQRLQPLQPYSSSCNTDGSPTLYFYDKGRSFSVKGPWRCCVEERQINARISRPWRRKCECFGKTTVIR
jgi:hypothetical protein